jgi:predicted AAA+ superfamily ATPase
VAFRADPDAALRGLEEPVLLDEWQEAPGVLGAVKRAVDRDSRPGRYLLTGSVRADLDAPTWPGTGRLVRVPLFGMSVAEQLGRPRSVPLLDRLARGDTLAAGPTTPDLRGYVELAGGGIVGIEIKADAAPRGDAARHLFWLRDRLGQRFVHGVVLHTGPRAYAFGERISAVPISTLWA